MSSIIKVAAAVPAIRVADVAYNTAKIIECAEAAEGSGAEVIVFPELCLTGCTCGALFRLKHLTDAAMSAALQIAKRFAGRNVTILLSVPGRDDEDVLTDLIAILKGGTIAALIPKNGPAPFCRNVYPDGICFSSTLPDGTEISCDDAIGGITLPLECGKELAVSFEATIAEAGRAIDRRKTAERLSAGGVYITAQPGCSESTTDCVYDGQALIAFNGKILAETKRFSRKNEVICAEIDLAEESAEISREPDAEEDPFDPAPFLLRHKMSREALCGEIFTIQATGLARRIEASGTQKVVIGISGGLDSTLALLVAAESLRMLGRTPDQLIAITMPGFGTTGRTKSNAEKMAEELECDLRKIDIKAVCLQHFADIGHDKDVLDVTYENTQARERTQILMDVANRERGLVAGTGDLSEIALGWCTFNGDHISMYNVNCGVPKTLMRVIVSWYADRAGGRLKNALYDVLATPVSPELLPADASGKIAQKTESILGAYELHDFYIWHFIKRGESPEKIREAAEKAFAGTYPAEEIDRTLKLFFKRFFTQQFKRSCCADGPHTTAVSLSPRTDWYMPSDASAALWLAALEGK